MTEDIQELLADRWWRLCHLYHIIDKEGNTIRFKPNWAQERLFREMHNRNDVLKVRQLGISTFVQILSLDMCLFGKNQSCGVIDKSLDDAKEKLAKVKFSYENLDYLPDDPTPEDRALAQLGALLKAEVKARFSKTSVTFSTGSSIKVGTSMRGRTLQLLHVSELAYVAAHSPIRARNIVNGGINAVSKNSVVIRESTHEGGKWGLNYEMTVKSMEMVGKELTPLDWRFFFFSWVQHDEYRLEDADPPDDEDLEAYFEDLQIAHGVTLDDSQKAWYAAQRRTFGHAVRQEYPTVPEEAFQTQVEGAIYGRQIDALRAEGKMNAVFEVDESPLYTSWDLGLGDYMSIWLWQVRGDGRFYVVDHYSANDEDLAHYINHVRRWEAAYGVIHRHLLPHDARKRDWEMTSFETRLQQAGFSTIVVPRTPDIWAGIMTTRRGLKYCIFHERCSRPVKVNGKEYMSGVNAVENYQTAPLGRNGVERSEPLHNACSHAASALRTFFEGEAAGFVGKGASIISPRKKRRGGVASGVTPSCY